MAQEKVLVESTYEKMKNSFLLTKNFEWNEFLLSSESTHIRVNEIWTESNDGKRMKIENSLDRDSVTVRNIIYDSTFSRYINSNFIVSANFKSLKD